MVVSNEILQTIENNRSRLVNDLTIKHLLIDLRNEHIITDDEVDELEPIMSERSRNDRFVRILCKRDDEAFYKFCNLLLRNQATAIRNIGRDLLQQISNDKNEPIPQIIEKYRSRLVNELPIKNLLIDLRNSKILTDDDVDELYAITRDKIRNDRFIRILATRGNEAFSEFCQLLMRNQANAIKNFGRELLQQVNNVPGATVNQSTTQNVVISDKQAQKALEDCWEDFHRFVPVDDILFPLERKGIISNRQRVDIKTCYHSDDKVEKLFDILYQSRTANDFTIFCQLLREHNVISTKKFGEKLLSVAQSIKE